MRRAIRISLAFSALALSPGPAFAVDANRTSPKSLAPSGPEAKAEPARPRFLLNYTSFPVQMVFGDGQERPIRPPAGLVVDRSEASKSFKVGACRITVEIGPLQASFFKRRKGRFEIKRDAVLEGAVIHKKAGEPAFVQLKAEMALAGSTTPSEACRKAHKGKITPVGRLRIDDTIVEATGHGPKPVAVAAKPGGRNFYLYWPNHVSRPVLVDGDGPYGSLETRMFRVTASGSAVRFLKAKAVLRRDSPSREWDRENLRARLEGTVPRVESSRPAQKRRARRSTGS